MDNVELTAGWAKGKKGVLLRTFKEKHLGVHWNMAQVRIRHKRKWHILVVAAESVKNI